MDLFRVTFGKIVDSGAEKMSHAELRESEKKFHGAVDQAVAARVERTRDRSL